jgi:hypothetical protein
MASHHTDLASDTSCEQSPLAQKQGNLAHLGLSLLQRLLSKTEDSNEDDHLADGCAVL